jgi:hypothetical protein
VAGVVTRRRDVPAPLAQRLGSLGVPADTVAELVEAPAIIGSTGVVIYGSYGRGDQTPDSDVDVLVVAERPGGSAQIGIANVSIYTLEQLVSARESLFGMHLARDGQVILDTDGAVASALEQMGQPDPETLFTRIRHLGAVLDGDPADHLAGRIRVARYLLRTAVYVQAIADGEPCFSVPELAARAGEPQLVAVLSSVSEMAPPLTLDTFGELMERLRRVVGPLAVDPHGGLRNLIVGEWLEDRQRATLGALILAPEADGLDYTALAKVVL